MVRGISTLLPSPSLPFVPLLFSFSSPPYPLPSILLPFPVLRSRTLLNQVVGLESAVSCPSRVRSCLSKTNLSLSIAVRKPLVAIILGILQCTLYSRSKFSLSLHDKVQINANYSNKRNKSPLLRLAKN